MGPYFGSKLGHGRGWVPNVDYRLRKLKIPLLEREDVYGWVYKAERLFDMQGLATSGERLHATILEGIQESILEGNFIKVLKPDLCKSVQNLQSHGFGQAMKLALVVDENGTRTITGSDKGSTKVNVNYALSTVNNTTTEAVATYTPFRRMTDTEFTDKKAKGLCFRCNRKLGPGHRCPEKTLQVLLVDDEEGEEEEDEETKRR
ncbi:unnamed protein product [Lactuca saligna]|uniref:Uncharacterized protein n=1 Tax=Lactuca saligna TaxID=75948 RepID=A0AA36DYW4_LACSI|nr:unnamed protein product [Lactuca saligna]